MTLALARSEKKAIFSIQNITEKIGGGGFASGAWNRCKGLLNCRGNSSQNFEGGDIPQKNRAGDTKSPGDVDTSDFKEGLEIQGHENEKNEHVVRLRQG